MICTHCKKSIKHEDLEWFGADGDAIHRDCKPKIYREMERIATMPDSEFYRYMGVEELAE